MNRTPYKHQTLEQLEDKLRIFKDHPQRITRNQQQESKDKYQAGEAQGRYPKPAQVAKGSEG